MRPAPLASRYIVAPSGCWIWMGAVDAQGYGRSSRGRKKHPMAYRYVYETLIGDVPPGLELDHLCRYRRCVNPMHLQPVPKIVNCLRGQSFAAVNARKTRCDTGHEFTPENTYIRPNGNRDCRACIRARAAAYAARKRVAT